MFRLPETLLNAMHPMMRLKYILVLELFYDFITIEFRGFFHLANKRARFKFLRNTLVLNIMQII